jgi:hypothetical protein
MKILAVTVAVFLTASPVAAQTSHVQQPLGAGGQTNNSPLTNTGVICLQEMVATFCNVGATRVHDALCERQLRRLFARSLAVVRVQSAASPGGQSSPHMTDRGGRVGCLPAWAQASAWTFPRGG